MTESPNRRRFLQGTLAAGAVAAMGSASSPNENESNPTVRPGRVTWHADFAAACRASQRSGKPVFHFHMLGRLDQRFC